MPKSDVPPRKSAPSRWRIGLAVSGGADSTALLLLMAGFQAEHNFDAVVLHVDHGIRSDSAEDAAHVHRLAKTLALPFHSVSVKIRRRKGESIEMAARRVRLDFFAKMTRRLKLDAIATGHHADDVAETFILRLARGSGPEGLAGLKRISHVNGITFIRPLLDLRSDDLRAFLRSRNMTWREDSTNSDTSILRNKVRHMVLPWLRKNLDPRITEHLCKSAAILRGDISLPSADAPSPCTPKAEAAPAKFSLKISPSAGFERRAQSFGSFPAMCEIARRAVAGRSIELRTWLPGDRIAPIGMNGHARKLQDIFVTAKVPPSLRATLPVLAYANSNEIIWVPGYRIAASAAVASPNDPSWRLTLDLDEPTVSSPSRKA